MKLILNSPENVVGGWEAYGIIQRGGFWQQIFSNQLFNTEQAARDWLDQNWAKQ